jgi:hypothetical protein
MLNIGTANLRPFIKFNGKSGRWYAPSGEEIAAPFNCVFDLSNAVSGWIRFQEGEGPQRRIDPSPDQAAPNPGDGSKRAFVVGLYSERHFNGYAEFSSSSVHVGAAVVDLYKQWKEQRDQHPNQLPVVTINGTQTVRGKNGTNFKPVFAITGWTDRPTGLPDRFPVDEAEIWRSGTTSTPRPAAAPPAQPELGFQQPEF